MADDWLRHVKETPREYMLRIYDTIDQHGWVVQSVFDNDDDTAFAYTIGLTPKGLPELFIDQLNPQQAGMILNAAAARLVDGTLTLVGGQDIDVDLEFSVNTSIHPLVAASK